MKTIDPEVKAAVVAGMKELAAAVEKLWMLYEKHEELNDIQPPSMCANIVGSMDEWHWTLRGAIEDWQDIPEEAKE